MPLVGNQVLNSPHRSLMIARDMFVANTYPKFSHWGILNSVRLRRMTPEFPNTKTHKI